MRWYLINTLRPRQNDRHFADDVFKSIFLNENVWIMLKISLKFVPKGPINNNPLLVHIMAWRRPGDKPLSESMMDGLLTHICVARPQWVNRSSVKTKSCSSRIKSLLITVCIILIHGFKIGSNYGITFNFQNTHASNNTAYPRLGTTVCHMIGHLKFWCFKLSNTVTIDIRIPAKMN